MNNNKKNVFVTKDGLEELQKEYKELKDVKRPEILERVSQARSMGDLSENSEYTAAREELSLIDGRIEELSEFLKMATVIKEKTSGGGSTVEIGCQVTVSIGGKKEVFTVVGEWEADPRNKKISHESPLGKALIGKSVGESIEVEAPAGKITYAIKEIK